MKRRLLIVGILLLAGAGMNGPLWLGFAVNTLLYAVVLWLLICSPFTLRRVIRVRRGLCPACAYPRGEWDVCSECGKAIPSRKVTVT